MEASVREVLDSAAPTPGRTDRRGLVVGGLAVALVVGTAVAARPADGGPDVALRLVEHSGSALDGQRFVRLYFSVSASGGDAEVDAVEMVLGEQRQSVVAPTRIGEGSAAVVLVDVVPDCPEAVRALAAGTLDVRYRAGGAEQVARLPLPVQGSLPRLVTRRCAAG